ncbi:MAG: cysteine--tRNA ligase [Rhizobiales bacterium]|nr:cysteine--tRNA ligase [Hyphomicrobiales bacterium]
MTLKLYNTLTRTKEEFKPLDRKNVRMYVCGPTVYDYAHIGNARPVIVFDVLFRLLRHLYGAEHVTYVRNITDIDDKINARAREEGTSIRELTERTYSQFRKDIAALGVLEPTYEPRATETIPEMITIIERLIAGGHAYAAEGHVLFAVPSMKDYGQLSRRPLDEMIAGARVDVAPYKRDPMDFVLWKPSDAETPGWDSPWGRGRPGWHIECSAMSWKHLGEVFDIHGGGIDLVFPHHENELAQTRCAFGHDVMANIWMHNGFLQVEGQKMSKSLGNFVTINEALKDWPGEVMKYAMLLTHYTQPIDWTRSKLTEARRSLQKFEAWYIEPQQGFEPEFDATAPHPDVINALLDDLNTPEVFASLHRQVGDLSERSAQQTPLHERRLSEFSRSLDLLGLAPRKAELAVDEGVIGAQIDARLAARKAKNWAESDRIRDELLAMGIVLKDNKDGTTSWEVKR